MQDVFERYLAYVAPGLIHHVQLAEISARDGVCGELAASPCIFGVLSMKSDILRWGY
jgi:hypothetical protein